jgi:hypothetical protein
VETNSVSVLGWIARRPRPLDIQHGSCWRTAVCTRPLVRDSNSYHLPRSAGPNKLHTKTQPATLHNSFASPRASLAGLSPFNYSPAILPPGVARFSSSRGGAVAGVFFFVVENEGRRGTRGPMLMRSPPPSFEMNRTALGRRPEGAPVLLHLPIRR